MKFFALPHVQVPHSLIKTRLARTWLKMGNNMLQLPEFYGKKSLDICRRELSPKISRRPQKQAKLCISSEDNQYRTGRN